MSKKKKLKLTTQQKERLKRLEKYLEQNECWAGNADLKDLIQDGKYAVLGVRSPVFNTCIICDSEEDAHAICDFNPDTHSRVIDTDTGEELWEEEKGWLPRKMKLVR